MAPSLISLHLPVLLIMCAMLLHPAAASGDDLLMLDRFHRWMGAHGRSYPSADEKLRRFEVYRHNVESIEAANKESWRLGYELGENAFTDLTHEEFKAWYTGGALVPKEDHSPISDDIITTRAGDVKVGNNTLTFHLNDSSSPVPKSFDWRDEGMVTPAKAQGLCGSCWAFAAISIVESLNAINGGELMDLSEQELVDCDLATGQKGCTSGYIDKALEWIQAKGGVVTEEEYPYQDGQGQCKNIDSATRVGKVTGVKHVRGEAEMKLALLKRPIGVLIDGEGVTFKSYKNGIYKGPCSTFQNHCVALVGYGVNRNGEKYWILKNSWGETWGQKGFFYMRREADGPKGLCGVAVWGDYPVM